MDGLTITLIAAGVLGVIAAALAVYAGVTYRKMLQKQEQPGDDQGTVLGTELGGGG